MERPKLARTIDSIRVPKNVSAVASLNNSKPLIYRQPLRYTEGWTIKKQAEHSYVGQTSIKARLHEQELEGRKKKRS